MSPNSPHIFGIRHHGPGSARSVLAALDALKPDAVLVEGPPDAADILPLIAHVDMQPPVALLIYAPDDPHKGAFYPFAAFSPEWNALRYGLTHGATVRFIDLAQTYQMAAFDDPENIEPNSNEQESVNPVKDDPLGTLARAAGYPDGERWWDQLVEQRLDSTDLFKGILEAMTALRESMTEPLSLREAQREAAMRQAIRTTQKDGFERIAVVCGAWHAPALATLPGSASDQALLKGLPKIKVAATWMPWTHGRLSRWSGYGAGIQSPGWYQHVWEHRDHVAESWLTKTAHLLRGQDLDASTAQIIDATRLSNTLAAMRGRALPGLEELLEATQTVLCFGSDRPLELVQRELIIGEVIGEVPDNAPTIPLQQDLSREQRRLLMRPTAEPTVLNLDLRKPSHLDRSYLLHRLTLLGVTWGQKEVVSGKTGTFHEVWQLNWRPELTIALIEKSVWGNTVYDAATAYTRHRADTSDELPLLTTLINEALLADLPDTISNLVQRLQTVSALTEDVKQLMASLAPLADIHTYSNVRGTNAALVTPVIDGIVARVVVGLPGACAMLADEAAEEILNLIITFDSAIRLLNNPDYSLQWQNVLHTLVTIGNVHNLIGGRSARLLFDNRRLTTSDVGQVMRLETSRAKDPVQTSAWLEGFLRGSGTVLTHNRALLQIIDSWVMALSEDQFVTLLPLLRRTTSTFTEPERRQIGALVRAQPGLAADESDEQIALDPARANRVLTTIAGLLGLNYPDELR